MLVLIMINVENILTVTFNQFNMSLFSKSINFGFFFYPKHLNGSVSWFLRSILYFLIYMLYNILKFLRLYQGLILYIDWMAKSVHYISSEPEQMHIC